ncbi:MAG: PP0621 family protein [Thiohalobacteraceae bacterium]
MGILRLLLFIALGILIYRMWRNWRARTAAAGATSSRNEGKMLACEHCGLYFPEQDAVRDGPHIYCSDAHRLAHRQG